MQRIRKIVGAVFQSPGRVTFGNFWALLAHFSKMEIFSKNLFLHVFYSYFCLTSCQKSEKSHDPILRKVEKPRKTKLTKMGFSHFWPPWTKIEIFFEKSVFTRFLQIFLPNFMPKIRKSHDPILRKLWKTLKKPIWPLLAHFSKNGIFFEKSGFVTFLLIFLPNFM